MPSGMQVGLISHSADGFDVLHRVCVSAGHTPVVYIHARSLRQSRPSDAKAGQVVARIVESVPAGVDLLLPGSVRGLEQSLSGHRLDLMVCDGFPWKLSSAVLRIPRLGVLNVHPSLLPKYRGPIPIHWAIRNGDPDFGVTVYRMDENLDTGPIIVQGGRIPLDDDVDADLLFDRLDAATAELLDVALARVAEGFGGEPQDEAGASQAPWMEDEFTYIDWSRPRREVHNQVRTFRFGVRGSPGPLGRVGDAWLRVLRTSPERAGGIEMRCADGPLWIVESEPAPPDAVPSQGS